MTLRTLILSILVLASELAYASGGKNLNPNPGTSTTSGYIQNGDNAGNPNSGYFLAQDAPSTGGPGYNADHRLLIRIKNGETMYYGANRINGADDLLIQLRDAATGMVVATQLLSASGTTFTAGVGVIETAAEMNAGPQAIVGASGYSAATYVHAGATTDLIVEFLDDDDGGTLISDYGVKDLYDLWDFSVYDGMTEKPGRLHAKYWSFSANGGSNRLAPEFDFFSAVPNTAGDRFFIKGINLGGMQPWGFVFVSNESGTLTDENGDPTSDYMKRRESKRYTGVNVDGYPQYDNFVEDPDPEFWPSAVLPTLNFVSNSTCDISGTRGNLTVTFNQSDPGVALLVLDLDGTAGYQVGTRDVLVEQFFPTAGQNTILWNGIDGLGDVVPSGTTVGITFRYGVRPVHFPLFDAEANTDGFVIEDLRPYPPGTFGLAFWDDRTLAGTENTFELFGIPSSAGVHPWGSGDADLFNTWSYGALLEESDVITYDYDCTIVDSDADGVQLEFDLDDDNDGIPDLVENGGVDAFGDVDGDGIANYLDGDAPGFVDADGNGLDDRTDADGDGIINSLDRDSDNDGISDTVEAGGVDENGDGVIDNYVDADGDGFSDNVDGNLAGAAGSGNGLGSADVDNDGIPNFLDLDSDNDGIPDLVESGGVDTNGDGYVDGYNRDTGNFTDDTDGDGFADVYDGSLCVLSSSVTSGSANLVVISTGVGNENNALGVVNDTYASLDAGTDQLGLRLSGVVPANYPVEFRLRNTGGSTANDVEISASLTNGSYVSYEVFDIPANQPATTYSFNFPTEVQFVTIDKGAGGELEVDAVTFSYLVVTESCTANGDFIPVSGPDTDGDGFADSYPFGTSEFDGDMVPNMWDLDSDNDGIYDVTESGGTDAGNDGVIDGFTDTDNDGYADAVDGNVGYDATAENTMNSLVVTGADNGSGVPSSYPNANADGNGNPNYLDLDSDDDGCSDADEAYGSLDADGNDNGFYGMGSPPATETNGSVTAATYPGASDVVYDEDKGLCLAPIALNDEDLENVAGSTVAFSIIANDSTGIKEVPMANQVVVDLDPSTMAVETTLMVMGEGTWTYDPSSGVITFMPAMTLMGNPTDITYRLTEIQSGLFEDAMINVEYMELVPVELSIFSVRLEREVSVLEWTTLSEINNDYFVVEHSADGLRFFAADMVDGNGTTSERIDYRALHDGLVKGLNYYRLKQVDYDGSFEYSAVRSVRLDSGAGMVVFPNPAGDFIQFESFVGGRISIKDATGQLVREQSWESRVDVSDLDSGIYFFQVLEGKDVKGSGKFVKL